MKDVSCVDQLSFVQNVTNVPVDAPDLPVGARLHQCGETWATLGAGPKVITILREGYTLPFRIQPFLTTLPTIISGCVHPLVNNYLTEALHALMQKNAVELVRSLLVFFQQTFLGTKAQQPV